MSRNVHDLVCRAETNVWQDVDQGSLSSTFAKQCLELGAPIRREGAALAQALHYVAPLPQPLPARSISFGKGVSLATVQRCLGLPNAVRGCPSSMDQQWAVEDVADVLEQARPPFGQQPPASMLLQEVHLKGMPEYD